MKLAALVSGGKDGMFAAYLARKQGNEIACLITVTPESEESMLCHYPNTQHVGLQAKSMHVPIIHTKSDNGSELHALKDALERAKDQYAIEGIIHGGIRSVYQRDAFAKLAELANLRVLAPLWGSDDIKHMNALIDAHFKFIIIAVASDGLDDSWLGQVITSKSVAELEKLSTKFGFNPSFEGGEAETFVLDCPLFESAIEIRDSKTVWDGYRGRFEIQEAVLVKYA